MSSIIEELGTKITTTCNTDNLENYKGIFNDYDEVLDRIISKCKDNEEMVTSDVADRLQNIQSLLISKKHYQTGRMAESIEIDQTGNTANVGVTARSDEGFPYPLCIEFGRREVVPVNSNVLRWVYDGMTIFSKRSSAVSPDPFVDASIQETLSYIEDIVDKHYGGIL